MAPGLAGERGQHRSHLPAAGVNVARLQLARSEEALGEPVRAEFQAARRQRLALQPDEQLGGAATDVAEQQALVEHRHRLEHAEVDQASLLDAGDDLDVHPRLGARPLEEHPAVLCLPDRAGRHCRDRGSVDIRHLPEAGESVSQPPVALKKGTRLRGFVPAIGLSAEVRLAIVRSTCNAGGSRREEMIQSFRLLQCARP